MKILNATGSQFSIMSDRGDLIRVPNNQFSELFIASPNLVTAVMKVGNPDSIAIIIGSSYELEIARAITGSIPYLSDSEQEAVTKLFNGDWSKLSTKAKDINHSTKTFDPSEVKPYQVEYEKKVTELGELQNQFDALSTDFNKLKTSLSAVNLESYKQKIKELSEINIKLTSEKNNSDVNYNLSLTDNQQLKLKLDEANDKLSVKEAELTKMLSESIDDKTTEYKSEIEYLKSEVTELTNSITEKDKLIEDLNSTIDSLAAEDNLSDYQVTITDQQELIDNLKNEGRKTLDKIESMRTDFNEACRKFNLTKIDGVWIQN